MFVYLCVSGWVNCWLLVGSGSCRLEVRKKVSSVRWYSSWSKNKIIRGLWEHTTLATCKLVSEKTTKTMQEAGKRHDWSTPSPECFLLHLGSEVSPVSGHLKWRSRKRLMSYDGERGKKKEKKMGKVKWKRKVKVWPLLLLLAIWATGRK